jgi:hypothetical protein
MPGRHPYRATVEDDSALAKTPTYGDMGQVVGDGCDLAALNMAKFFP